MDTIKPSELGKGKRAAVIGAGLVGSLEAIYLGKLGYSVDVYEMRADIRLMEVVRGRSINLAMSQRARTALRAVGLEDQFVQSGIPMYARCIHDRDGKTRAIPYGQSHQFIMSIDRRKLNELLLTEAEKMNGVRLFFEHRFESCNFDSGEVTLRGGDAKVEVKTKYDLIVGCDGAYSAVRRQMMKSTRLDYTQFYIPHGYIELSIPPTADGQFAMPINYLHIWARETFMMIALPNCQDHSFVVTLFMPFANFEEIKTEDDLMKFAKENFADAIPLIGEESLKQTFFSSPPQSLIAIKCSPYHVGDKAVIIGDAAHAMVPFYGQGMNCGFEDCVILDEMLRQHAGNQGNAIAAYTAYRNPDATAICDLALANYVEMRSRVNSFAYLLRKKIDSVLHKMLRSWWIPLYSMVSFTRIRYSECLRLRQRQDFILEIAAGAGLILVVVGCRQLIRFEEARFNMFHHLTNKTINFFDSLVTRWRST